jgi:hypothetical protein
MRKNHNILFIISAVALIFIFLGMTPIKIGQKLTGQCPMADGKVAMSSTPCIFNTVTSQYHTDNVGDARLPPPPFVFNSTALLSGETIDNHVVIVSNYLSETPPLRC